MTEVAKHVARGLLEEGRAAFDLMDYVDRLNQRGVTCHPRLSARTGRYSFLFGFGGEKITPTGAQKAALGHGRLLYDPVRHNPIFSRICQSHQAGQPQPIIIRHGDVTLTDLPPAEPGTSLSSALVTSILRLNANPVASEDPSLVALPNGYDELTDLNEARLDKMLSDTEIPDRIDDLPEGHKLSAKRWMLRGLDPALAVVREVARAYSCEKTCLAR